MTNNLSTKPTRPLLTFAEYFRSKQKPIREATNAKISDTSCLFIDDTTPVGERHQALEGFIDNLMTMNAENRRMMVIAVALN